MGHRMILAWLAGLLLSSCTTLMGAQKIDAMDDAEFIHYTALAVSEVQAIVTVAVANEDLDSVEIDTVQAVLFGIADGSIAVLGSSLAQSLHLEGYGALALTLAVIQLDARFSKRGAYGEDGILSERAREVLRAVATGLEPLKPMANPNIVPVPPEALLWAPHGQVLPPGFLAP